MILKRGKRPSFLRRMQSFLWPEKGFARGWRYMRHRVERINDTPTSIAIGCAIGAFVSFSPLFGLHFIAAALIAKLVRVNIISALFGTAVGNPVTFPFIAAGSMSVGSLLLGRVHTETHADGEGIIAAFRDIGRLLYDGLRSTLGVAEPGTVTWSAAAERMSEFGDQVMLPYAIGGLICGVPVAVATFYIVRPTISAYQKRRSEKLAKRRKERAEDEAVPPAR